MANNTEPLPKVSASMVYGASGDVRKRYWHSAPVNATDVGRHRADSSVSAFMQWPSYVRWFREPEWASKDFEPLLEQRVDEEGHVSMISVLEIQRSKKLSSMLEMSINLIKCVVGAGSFVLPFAIAQSGLIGGVVGIFLFGGICGITTYSLIESKETLRIPTASYPQLGYEMYGWLMKVLIELMTVLAAMGGCSAYLVFTGQILAPVVGADPLTVIYCSAAFEVVMSMLRQFKYLAYTSVLGDLSVVLGLLIVLIDGFGQDEIFKWSELVMFKFDTFGAFIGSAAFLFAIPFLAVPLQMSMKEPREFKSGLTRSFLFCCILNSLFGGIGYMFYGDDTKSIVIENVATGTFADLVKVMLCADLLLTFPVVLTAPRDLVEGMVIKEKEEEDQDAPLNPDQLPEEHWYDIFTSVDEWKRNFVRAALCMVALGFAVGIGNITSIVTLNGGICQTLLTFIFPSMIYTKAHWHRGMSHLMMAWQAFIFVIGFVIMYVATSLAVQNL
eukprot:GFYU01000940.1.p1 GENE.GFYU01000940.1~~GFYU01000940.1.p1  ORF type:complete len:500 (+),score=153.00 GFYU01000940.1:151-1650(+)